MLDRTLLPLEMLLISVIQYDIANLFDDMLLLASQSIQKAYFQAFTFDPNTKTAAATVWSQSYLVKTKLLIFFAGSTYFSSWLGRSGACRQEHNWRRYRRRFWRFVSVIYYLTLLIIVQFSQCHCQQWYYWHRSSLLGNFGCGSLGHLFNPTKYVNLQNLFNTHSTTTDSQLVALDDNGKTLIPTPVTITANSSPINIIRMLSIMVTNSTAYPVVVRPTSTSTNAQPVYLSAYQPKVDVGAPYGTVYVFFVFVNAY